MVHPFLLMMGAHALAKPRTSDILHHDPVLATLPNNHTHPWDRPPITFGFQCFGSIKLGERFGLMVSWKTKWAACLRDTGVRLI
jgi:hypothetical protein